MKKASHIFTRIKAYSAAHTFISALIALVIIGGGYYGYKKATTTPLETRYVLAAASRGTLIASITGSGQVSASNQIDIKPKVSGDVIYVGVKNGDRVTAGRLIAEIDPTDAEKAVRNAETSLETAKLELDKLNRPADTVSLLQSENSLADATEGKKKAEDDLAKAYEDGFTTIANAFLDFPTIMAGLQDMLFGSTLGTPGQWNIDYYADRVRPYDDQALSIRDATYAAYQAGRTAYDKNFIDYKNTARTASHEDIETLIAETYDTSKKITDAVKGANNLIQFYKDTLTKKQLTPIAAADTHLSTLTTYTSKTNTNLTALLEAKNTIDTDKNTIVSANRTIVERTASDNKLKEGPDSLDVRSLQLTITDRANALTDAKNALSNYYIRAPFDGIMATVDVKKGDSAGSGSAVATIITAQNIAEITLNEVDVAKVKVGEKATLTFDAIDGLTITGEVVEIDTVGTVSQGVVTYAVKIAFDTQDERVKSGMSVNAAIITNVKQDVLSVPNSAIKNIGDAQYVETADAADIANVGSPHGVVLGGALKQVMVETGLTSDTATEIISGLSEGDMVVTRTITAGATQTTQSAPTLFGGTRAAGGAGGGTVRFQR